jgi:NADP-dependent 3-hydroxy acid dehydrogenase YdfG
MDNIRGKTIVITGASSGIGEETVRLLAKHGANVAIGARRVARLEALAAEIKADGGSVFWKELDVTSQASVEAFADAASMS